MLDDAIGAIITGVDLLVFPISSVLDWTPSFSTCDPPELQKAYEAASETLTIDARNTAAHFTRGVICQSKGWHAQALADFVDVIQRQPDHARAWMLSSEALDNLGDYERARVARQRALELDPTLV
jgi:tetratricopeptide (TPR) repeat protein